MLNAILLPVILSLLGCKAPPNRTDKATVPILRIGIVESRSVVDIKFDGRGDFVQPDGSFSLRGMDGGHWKIEVEQARPATISYRLSVGMSTRRSQAEEIVGYMQRKGLQARIQKFERGLGWSLPNLGDAVYHVLLAETFVTREAAQLHKLSIKSRTNADIIAIPNKDGRGTLRFTNIKGDHSFVSEGPIRLFVQEVQVANIDVGRGFHWESSEHRSYDGIVEFLVDPLGKITVINEIDLEAYLRGVVSGEMPAGFPIEALKAQAIASRNEAVAKAGLRHAFEPFDLCANVHCQVFAGRSRRSEATDRAVASTRGIFMLYRGEIAKAFFGGVCGGHTESNENAWLVDAKPYLRGILDHRAKRLNNPLQKEFNLKKWIDSRPDVYCNLTRDDLPKSLDYARKYFRWRVAYSAAELARILREKTGENFGELQDLAPGRRGVSGRLIELKIVGSKKDFTLTGELAIRRALSASALFSSCFYVEKKGPPARPTQFVLHGGGWGHGVGMCQVGAAVMAHENKKFDQILRHYYSGVYLDKVYK